MFEFMRGGPPPRLLISEPPWARRGAFPSRWRKVDRGAWQRTALARAARLSLIQARVWLEGLHAPSPSWALDLVDLWSWDGGPLRLLLRRA